MKRMMAQVGWFAGCLLAVVVAVGCGGAQPAPICGDGLCDTKEEAGGDPVQSCCEDCGCPTGQSCHSGSCVLDRAETGPSRWTPRTGALWTGDSGRLWKPEVAEQN
jgi:hypothetical protein